MTPPRHEPPAGGADRAASFHIGTALRRHWLPFALCLVGTPVAAGVVHQMTPPVYASQARVLIKLGREFMGPPSATGRQGSMYRLNEAINSEIEILRSRQLAARVVESVGVERLFPELEVPEGDDALGREMASAAFLESVSVTGIAESSVIRIALAHEDPMLAREALDSLVQCFHEQHLTVFAANELGVVEAAVTTARASLAAAEEARSEYRERVRVYDPVEERTLLLRRRDGLDLSLRELRASAARLEHGSPTEGGVASRASDLERQLDELRAEERRLLENYYPRSQAVQAVRAHIEALEAVAARRAEAETAVLAEDEERLVEALAEVDGGLAALQVHERSLRELDRAVTRQEAFLAEALAARQAAELDAKLDEQKVTSVSIIDPASLPLEPIGLQLKAKVALGTFAGTLLGAALVFLLHLLTSSPQTARTASARASAHSSGGFGSPPLT